MSAAPAAADEVVGEVVNLTCGYNHDGNLLQETAFIAHIPQKAIAGTTCWPMAYTIFNNKIQLVLEDRLFS